jgi:nondiscriminating glutamyl-tRNA synthetase
METSIRVRFAPSPTGLLHVGNARTALFNYLFARKMEGALILRMEDTDVERSTAESEEAILKDLRWLGFQWDEGPGQGGNYGPYRQSERLEIYRHYAFQLLEKGHAYRCYCPPEELEEKRKRSLAQGIPPKYDGRCRYLTPEEEQALTAAGRPASLRFKVAVRRVEFDDRVKGCVSFDGQGIGDFIILRSDGVAPYNFAVVIDDTLMKVTHVIRGEDHLTNTPRQLLIYQALGFPSPEFAHLPMILGKDHAPLSKRQGATAVRHFREEGYLPEALANYLALLGWSSEDGREIFNLAELSHRFSLHRVSRSAAVFDVDKLKWVNRAHLKSLPKGKALEQARPFLEKSGINLEGKSESWLTAVLDSVWGEVDTLSGLAGPLRIFFDEGWAVEPETASLFTREESRKVLYGLMEELKTVQGVTPENYKPILTHLGNRMGFTGRNLYLPLRAALTGKTRGPELEKIFVLLGKEKILQRVESVLRQSEAKGSRCNA